MFCFSILFTRANNAVKHSITFKKHRQQARIQQSDSTFIKMHALVCKYNKKLLFFQKKY